MIYANQGGREEQAEVFSEPIIGATVIQAVQRFFRKYATFSGRASRSECWWWVLVSIAVSIAVQGPTTITDHSSPAAVAGFTITAPGLMAMMWGLGTIMPSLSLLVRRLHDVNISGWLVAILFVPLLGLLALLVLTALPSNPDGKRFD